MVGVEREEREGMIKSENLIISNDINFRKSWNSEQKRAVI
jgi:hypothetical protein